VDASWIALLTPASRRLDGGRRASQGHPPSTTYNIIEIIYKFSYSTLNIEHINYPHVQQINTQILSLPACNRISSCKSWS